VQLADHAGFLEIAQGVDRYQPIGILFDVAGIVAAMGDLVVLTLQVVGVEISYAPQLVAA
jgi:hypothetical protein